MTTGRADEVRRSAERLAGLTEPYLTLDQAAHRAGLDAGQVAAIWSSSGLPTPAPHEAALGDGDVEILRAIAELQSCGLAEPAAVLQLARVTGRHLQRVTEAQIDTAQRHAVNLTDHVRHVVPVLERALVHLWRRHLADAATKALLDQDDDVEPRAIAFVDLVGFTARSQQLGDDDLAALITRFEDLATRTVGGHGGTIVKTMGDEIMYVHRNASAASHTALELIEGCDRDPLLPAARGGIAWGHPLLLGGDYFGPPVNLASRITRLAMPGTVLVDPALAEALDAAGVETVLAKPLRPQPVRDVGTISLHVLRRPTSQSAAA